MENSMSDPKKAIQLPLTAEQQELIHRITGERPATLELAPDSNPSGPQSGLKFNWRIPTDSETPEQH
jgi:hypothetical protein